MTVERRYVPAAQFRVDAGDSDVNSPDSVTLIGYAAVFNALSNDLGGFYERIAPGAFTRAVAEDDVRALFNHSENYVLGRTTAGTLQLMEDDVGLRCAIKVDMTNSLMRDMVLAPIKRGDISQMSFAFNIMPDGATWDVDEEGRYIRTVNAVRLYDVSPVTYPAYPQTEIAARSLEAFREYRARKQAEFPEQQALSEWRERAKRRLRLLDAE